MDERDWEFLSTFDRFMKTCLAEAERREESAQPRLRFVVEGHLGVSPGELPVVRLDVAAPEFVNLDIAVAELIRRHGGGELVGVGGGDQRHHHTFADLLNQDWGGGMRVGAVDRARVDTGPASHREAVSFGVHLFRYDGTPVAMLQRRSDPQFRSQCGVEVIAAADVTSDLLADVRGLMLELNVFRGQVLSFTQIGGEYEPSTGGITFLERPNVGHEDVILPPGTLDRAERHVVGTARHREALLAAGQHLKRGLLLYGPPGTGKTHTIRYLISGLTDVTVFLLSGITLQYISATATMAKVLQPSVVVLEDVDLIAEERHFHGPQTLLFNLLDAMDGLTSEADIAFVLTTNRVDLLERALSQRPGRVDLALEIPRPDETARLALLRLYARSLPVSADALSAAASATQGVTASFFKELARRTVLVAQTDETPVDDEVFAAVLQEMLSDADELTRTLLSGADIGGNAPGGPAGFGFSAEAM